MQTFELVLARLNENIDWIAAVPPQIKVTIYNFKALPVTIPRPAENCVIKDAGQESGAYCEHVIRNWDRLADITIFSQADPIPHCIQAPSFISRITDVLKNPPTGYLPIGDKCQTSCDDPLVRRVWIHHRPHPDMKYSKTPLKDACLYLLGHECPTLIGNLAFGAIFALPREKIKKHPMEFYQKLHRWNAHAPKTVECAILEKLWPVIFE